MTRLLLLLALVMLQLPVGAQTLDEVLPPGIVLDEAGRLQWSDSQPIPCDRCEGSKVVACARCVDAQGERDCAFCSRGRAACPSCGATGVTLDAFEATRCGQCDGRQREPCPTCHGKRVRLTRDGEQRCAGCEGSGAFVCPLCAGTGRLPVARVAGKDPRTATRQEVAAAALRITDLVRALEAGARGPDDVDQRLRVHAEFLAEFGESLPLPDGQIERLQAILRAAASDAEAELAMASVIREHRLALSQYAAGQLALLRTCTWRLRRNAGEADEHGPPQPASAIGWKQWFGEDPANPARVYCLLGRGFLRSPAAENTAQVIGDWLAEHPAATVRPIAAIDGFMRGMPDSQLVYVWVVDGEDNLNLHLVERGCVMAGTMTSPIREIEVPLAEYVEFLRAVRSAEAAAREAGRGYWGSAELARENHEAAGKHLMKEGRHAEALARLRAAVEAGGGNAYLWFDIAECHERLAQWEEALAAYDEAIGDGRWWPPYARRAHCLRRWRGLDAAIEWLAGLAEASPDDHAFPHILGGFLRECGETKKAIPHLARAVELASRKHGFRFDDQGWLVLDAQTLAKDNNDYADLWPTLEYLARSLLEIGDPAAAMRYATMGVAIGQQLGRCKGYYSEAQVEAGDVDCRLVRARVFLGNEQWDAAEKELRLAKVLTDHSSYTGWVEAIAEIERELASKR